MINRRNLLIGGAAVGVALGGAAWTVRSRMGSMADYEAAIAGMRRAAAMPPETHDLIRIATLAPSGHNTQPWLFRSEGRQISILPDFSRRTPVVDPDDHHVFVSLGCAAETLAIASGAAGRAGELSFDPVGDGSVRFSFGSANASERPLFDAIPYRQSTRADYDGSAVSASDLNLLAGASTVPGVDLVLITDRPQIELLRDMVLAGNSAQMADPAFVAELKAWMRFNPRAALGSGDGLFSACSGNPVLPGWLGPPMLDMVFSANAENAKYASQIASSAGIAVFAGAEANPAHWMQVGRACQRFALQATALGLKCAFLNQPVEVPILRADLASLAGMPGRRPDIVMRFGRGPALPFSARRPVEAVMV